MSEAYSVRNPERLGAGAIIPPMTHPLGKHWPQPDRERILVDHKNAIMDKRTFDQLSEYTTTVPSGVYDGKMWRAQQHDGLDRDGRIRLRPDKPWLLRWYGPCSNPGQCAVNAREIIIV